VNSHFQLNLAKEVFQDFKKGKDSEYNEQLIKVRSVFDSFNLIEGLHTLYAQKNPIYKNILPPLRLLNEKDKIKLFSELGKLNFNIAA
jgi:4-hydroxy-tetrahydrodipicolinate synthase